MKKLAIVLTLISFVSGCKSYEYKSAKYTVWVGDSAFASGYCADEYSQSGSFINFIALPRERQMSVPLSSILSIDGGCNYKVRIENE